MGIQQEHKRQQTHKILPEHQELLFLCVGDRALVQVVQRGGGHSNPRETQNQTGHGPEQELTADVF